MKYVYFALGIISLFIALIGALAPFLPGFVFLIFAAFCFARGSERFNKWLRNHKRFGPVINRYQDWGIFKVANDKSLNAHKEENLIQ